VLLEPSAGADIAIVEAGRYHDMDTVIVCFHTARLQPALFEVDVDAWFSQEITSTSGVIFALASLR
jgi:hypothetical protein